MYLKMKIITLILFLPILICKLYPVEFSKKDLMKIKQYRFGDEQTTLVLVEQYLADADPSDRKIMIRQLTSILPSDADYAAKQFVCRQLAQYGNADAIPVLIPLLSDESLADMARYALGRIPHPSVDAALREALDKASDDIKLGLISTIGERRDTEALDKLEILLNDENPKIVHSSAAAMGKIAGEKAAKALLKLRQNPDWKNDPFIADALLSCADAFVTSGKKEQAIPIYQTLFNQNYPAAIRAAALTGLQKSGSVDAFDSILISLKDKDALVTGTSARLTLAFPGEENTQRIIQSFQDLSKDAQIQMLSALGDRGDKSAIKTIELACDHSIEEVRSAALMALARLGDASHLPLLLDRASHGSDREQQAAQSALMDIEIVGLASQINALFKTADTSEKITLLTLAAQRNITGVIENVFLLTKDQDQRVRQTAFKAIGQIAAEQHMNQVINLWQESSQNDTNFSEDMLVRYAKRLGQDDQPDLIYKAQIDWGREGFGVKPSGHDELFTTTLLEQANTKVLEKDKVLSLIRIFGRLGDDRTLPYLQSQLKNDNDAIKSETIRALSSWSNYKPLEDLWTVAFQSQNETHKILALRGFIGLIPFQSEEAIKNYNQALAIASDAERRLILGQVSQMNSFAAFDLAAGCLNDKPLQAEAALAAIAISHRMYLNHLDSVEEVIREILTLDLSQDINAQAQNIMGRILMARDIAFNEQFDQVHMVSLFDGNSFENWEGNPDYFRIEDSALVAGSLENSIPQNEFLCTTTEYSDFELKLKFKLIGPKDKANAGIQIRSQRIPDDNEMIGYQADIGQQYWGSLYDESRRRKIIAQADTSLLKQIIRQNDWNEYLIRCVGKRIQLWLNGIKTVDYVEPDDTIAQKGVIGLQIHSGPPIEIWYKDIVIKELPRSPRFRKHTINQESKYEAGTFADIDNDGRLDLFCGGFWYQAPDWQKHFVRQVPEQDEYYFDFAAVPMDVDVDGWTDIVNGSWHGKDVFWLRNPALTGKGFDVVPIDEPGNLETLLAVDLNNDNIMDILPNTVSSLVWYQYNGALAKKWKKHELTKEAAGHGIGAGDINNDGLHDIITPKGWLQQPRQKDGEWIWHKEFDLKRTSIPILVNDVDDDGDTDLIWGDGHGYGVYWLEQTSDDDGKKKWSQHEIDSEWSQSHFLILADLDNDGKEELITGKRVRAHNGHDPGGYDPPCVYYYQYDKNKDKWHRYPISERENAGFGIFTSAQDYDGDGDIDILAPGKSGLYLFENLYVE